MDTTPRFVKVATTARIHDRCGTLVSIDGEDIALFRDDGKIFAISNVCAHQHFSMLHQGEKQGCEVMCPMHGWTYDIRTGKSTTGQGKVAMYKVRIEGEDVFVELPHPL